MSVGNRVFLKRKLPDAEIIKQFEQIPASNVADTMNRSSTLNPRIRLMSSFNSGSVAGPALTVKLRAGDNLMLHKALNIAQEGDIIVVSNEADNTRALMGEIMFCYAFYAKKVAAIILDGPIRDTESIMNMPFPIYATGMTPGGPYKEGPGEVNVPISCGEACICPGDIILADKDGIVIIPQSNAEEVLEASLKFMESDKKKLEAAMNGTANRSWVEEKLKEKKTEIIDDFYIANM